MATILTSKGIEILVDDDDFEKLSQYKWHINDSGYVRRCKRINGKLIDLLIHREIFNLKPGDKQVVDHINHCTTDNRKENLRVVTCQQNQWNTSLSKINKSGYTGVSFTKNKTNSWRACIYLNKKQISLGFFATPELAYEAYLAAKAKYHTFD